ncbi:hypothetical protein [Deinococcus roseus]|uniref:Uncharacterized protein n=1 Tax=Deinococcus roseus TaxID=392414 RepID=A0ABQ2DBN5_9DEIO|nr:hypothetical protein [Deinococcus roseus]GGJ48860.1 hypothetical protein GCM10008938_38600 [Deinococcus roseus]
MKKIILVAALLFAGNAALAEDTPPPMPSPTATVAVAATRGWTITFVDASGTVVATLNPDGTLNATGDLSTARQVVVKDAEDKTATYDLASDLSKPGQVKVTLTVEGKTQTLPLVAVLNKAQHQAKADKDKSKDHDDDADEAVEDHGKSGEDHGKSGEDHGKSGEDHGKSGEDHGKSDKDK